MSESERAARRVEGSLPKQASVVELNKRRSYQFIMGRHVAHARAYGAPAVSLSLYNGVHASGFREPVYTNYTPGPPHHQRPTLPPPGRPRPPLAPSPVISMRLFISLAPSRRLPFISRISLYPPLRHYVSPSLFAALRYEGTN